MKRPLAYLTAAWSGEPDVDMELAAHYCRLAYEAGFSPICPLLYLPLFLNDSVPEEHKAGNDRKSLGDGRIISGSETVDHCPEGRNSNRQVTDANRKRYKQVTKLKGAGLCQLESQV